jgi:hypothetical protein
LEATGELVNQSGRDETATALIVSELLVPHNGNPKSIGTGGKEPLKAGPVCAVPELAGSVPSVV